MAEYFKRKINEGTVKRTHICSFDKSIKLEMIVTGSKKVVDYIIKAQSTSDDKAEFAAKQNFMNTLSGLRINGLPIVFEDLNESFDSEEILEVQAFVNGVNMKIFGGKEEEEPKNA